MVYVDVKHHVYLPPLTVTVLQAHSSGSLTSSRWLTTGDYDWLSSRGTRRAVFIHSPPPQLPSHHRRSISAQLTLAGIRSIVMVPEMDKIASNVGEMAVSRALIEL